ncbi:mevalonate kinase [Lacticaseibacillus yichunensis]|uniref:Mevalonate kinase n=1 Tax=Lacticaseibacillus yichunensis TaxID=2486015 RepID=A0ABW4CT80_9LACO|nr:mevalonate kinase [Lacticaseibacillus yichunensis]
MRKSQGISYAKIILIGEHAVVYQQPAIALPIRSLTVTATLIPRTDDRQQIASIFYQGSLADAAQTPFAGIATLIRRLLTFFEAPAQGFDLAISSMLPPERGMGSSAATAVAIIRAVYQAFDAPLPHDSLLNWANVSERIIHGNPSGLDAATASATAPQWFVRGQAPTPIDFPTTGSLVIADTGVPGQTKTAVASVAAKLTQDPAHYQPLIEAIGQATSQAALALAQDDLPLLGRQLTISQNALRQLGVSSPALNQLVAAALNAGALGAKLTGSGQGGCMIALTKAPAQAVHLRRALEAAGATTTWQYDLVESEDPS